MHKFFGFLCLILLFSCDKEKEIRSTSLQPPLVTGFIFKDVNGSPITQVGEANVKTEGTDQEGHKSYLATYPNPVQDQVAVQLYSPNPGAKKSIWVVAARQNENLNSFNFMQANTAIIGGQPLIKVESIAMQNVFLLDLSNLPAGAYRIYAQIDDVLLWDNILKIN